MKKKKATGRTTTRSRAKGSTVGNIVITTLAIGAAGIVGYLGWQYMKKRRQKDGPDLDTVLKNNTPTGTDLITPLPGTTATPPFVPPVLTNPLPFIPTGNSGGNNNAGETTRAADGFPLKKGSKGENVRLLQDALIRKHGRQIMPRYGADGDFGSETVNALKKLKLPVTISETLFNVLVQGGGSSGGGRGESIDHSVLGTNIYKAAVRKDFPAVLTLLRQIKSSSDYSTVSESFKRYRLNGVRQTLVNGLLNTFRSSGQKEQLRLAFATIGLSYDGQKWSLSGIDGIPIMTIRPTQIWVNARTAVRVPARMVLGQEIARKLQYVLFSNNGRYFLVHSGCIRPL